MQGKHAVTSNTVDNLVLDAGVLFFNYGEVDETQIGATRGGSTWNLNRSVRKMGADGARGPIKGMSRIESVAPTLQINVLEMTKANLLQFIAGHSVDEVSNATHDLITGKEIDTTDYVKNVALLATISGSAKPVIVVIKNALAEGDWSLQLQDKNEATPSVTFGAHFDPSDINETTGAWPEPWEVRYPKSLA